MLPDLTSRVLRSWHILFPQLDRPPELHYVGISGSVEGGTATFLAFGGRGSRPLFVAKVFRDPEAHERVNREHEVVTYLHSLGGTLAAVPRALAMEQIGRSFVLVNAVVEGQPMRDNGLGEDRRDFQIVARNLDLASSWLSELACATRISNPEVEAALIHELFATSAEFASTFDLSPDEHQVLQEITEGAPQIIRGAACVEHRDFIRENILVTDRNQVNVIDWSDSRRVGFPVHDLFFFLTNYFSRTGRGSGIERYRSAFLDTFFQTNPYSLLVTECVAKHARATALGQECLDALFGLFLVNHAMFEYHKVRRQSQRGVVPKGTMHLAAESNADFRDAPKQQVWIHFFRLYVQQRMAGHQVFAEVLNR